jgi:uncharacterized membrane protein
MSSSMGGPAPWESLAPWEKAAEWHAVAPDISQQVMTLARQHAEHQWNLDNENAIHRRKMEARLWWTQLIGLIGGMGNVAALALVAWHYADTGNIVPGLAMFGAGTSLTAGVYAIGRSISKKYGSYK